MSFSQHYVGGNAALMAVKVSELFPKAQVTSEFIPSYTICK